MNRKLFGLGAPILFQNVIISVGGLAVQFVINGYGFLLLPVFTATNKLYGVLEMAAISYGYAVVSYVGQNLGAGEITRIKKGVHASSFLAFLTSAFISIVMFLFGRRCFRCLFPEIQSRQVRYWQSPGIIFLLWHPACVSFIFCMYIVLHYRGSEIP